MYMRTLFIEVKMETTQVSLIRRMAKQNVVYSHSGILLSHKED
jgi:hypothetical protein